MLFLYQLILTIFTIFLPIIFLYRVLKNKEDKKRFVEKFGITSQKKKGNILIWFHCASVGEILSIIPLIKVYEKKKFIDQILITSTTLSSSKIFKKFKFKKTIHQFYPLDYFFFTQKFLNYWKPNIAIFIESEIWPYMYNYLNKKNIPLILLNARLTEKTYKKWVKIKNISNSIFDKITITFPQNKETINFLKKLNVNKISYLGNLKFVENHNENQNNLNRKLKLEFSKKIVWVASSTHMNEEIFCAKAQLELKKKFKNIICVIIPRHIHRVKEIIKDIKSLNLKVILHSENKKNLKNVDIYIVDTFGETNKFHKISSSVFLGGSIIKRGGQNPLEAARYGAEILHGPNTDNFKDIYSLLKKLKISKKISTYKQLATSLSFKKNKYKGNKIKNIGDKILKKTIKQLDNLIYNEIKKT